MDTSKELLNRITKPAYQQTTDFAGELALIVSEVLTFRKDTLEYWMDRQDINLYAAIRDVFNLGLDIVQRKREVPE